MLVWVCSSLSAELWEVALNIPVAKLREQEMNHLIWTLKFCPKMTVTVWTLFSDSKKNIDLKIAAGGFLNQTEGLLHEERY